MSDHPPKTGHPRSPLLELLYKKATVFRDYQPLAIGIHKSLMDRFPDVDKRQVRTVLHFHTGTTRYLKAIVEGAPRFDLDGNPSDLVTADQQAQAAATLRERFKRGAERHKTEQKSRQRQENIEKLVQKYNPR